MYKTCLALVSVLVAGCSSTSKIDPYIACLESVARTPAYVTLASKMSLGTQKQGIAMLASNERASELEKPLIAAWYADREQCIAKTGTVSASSHSPVQQHADLAESMTKTATASLYAGTISYGDYARQRQAIEDALRKDLAALQTDAGAEKRRGNLIQLQNQIK